MATPRATPDRAPRMSWTPVTADDAGGRRARARERTWRTPDVTRRVGVRATSGDAARARSVRRSVDLGGPGVAQHGRHAGDTTAAEPVASCVARTAGAHGGSRRRARRRVACDARSATPPRPSRSPPPRTRPAPSPRRRPSSLPGRGAGPGRRAPWRARRAGAGRAATSTAHPTGCCWARRSGWLGERSTEGLSHPSWGHDPRARRPR